MKRLRRHSLGLVAVAVSMLSMLLLTTTSFAAPARSPSMVAMAGCHEASLKVGRPLCSKDCAVICHAIVFAPVELIRLASWTSATYIVTFPHSSPVSVEADDPPPRSDPG